MHGGIGHPVHAVLSASTLWQSDVCRWWLPRRTLPGGRGLRPRRFLVSASRTPERQRDHRGVGTYGEAHGWCCPPLGLSVRTVCLGVNLCPLAHFSVC